LYKPEKFAAWLHYLLADFSKLAPVSAADRSDGKLAHFDGLNLSRAWMLRGIAHGLPLTDIRRPELLRSYEAHRKAGLEAVLGEGATAHYEGTHWLATFAVYLETEVPGESSPAAAE
jgi:hypothetical protein